MPAAGGLAALMDGTVQSLTARRSMRKVICTAVRVYLKIEIGIM